MILSKQNWWQWLDYWMSQDASNWHPLSWAMGDNPILIALHLIAGSVLALSFISILISYIYLSRKHGYTNKEQKLITVFFGLFMALLAGTFIMREVTFFVPVYWLYGSVKLLAAVFAFLSAVTYVRFVPYLSELPSISEMERVKAEREEFARKAKLLNEHINVWQDDIGYHINLLKGQQKALADDLASKGLPVVAIEDVREGDGMTKLQALESLEKIQGDLNSLFESVNKQPDDK